MKYYYSNRLLLVLLTLLTCISCQENSKNQTLITWSNVPVDSTIQSDQKIEEVIFPYRQALDSIMGEVIGYAAHDLTTIGEYESNLGTFVTRLSLEQCESIFEMEIDVAVMNHHGGLRSPINKGAITLGEIFQVMPFENEMVLLEVPGPILLEVVDKINGSGSSMLWPVTFTATESGPKDIELNGDPILSKEVYLMAISDYLANGGGGFSMLRSLKRIDVPAVKLRDIIVKEIRETTSRGESVDQRVSNHVIVIE